ncbi:Incenp family protein [Megaselia abdita]
MAGLTLNPLILQEICSKMYDLLFSKSTDSHNKTPQQIKKKKRLTAILDTDDEESFLQRKSKSPNTTRSGRPGRAAKAKAENNLKEPDVRSKMRQTDMNSSSASTASVEITNRRPPTYDLGSSDEERDEFRMPPPKVPSMKSKKIVIKAEKLSFDGNDGSTIAPSVSTVSSTSSTETIVPEVNRSIKATKPKKKKDHVPIKVERISEVFEEPEYQPVRSRTRSQRNSKKNSMESVYEDALPGPEIPNFHATQNATVNLGGNPNATVNVNETMNCNATVNMGPNATVNMGPNATVNMGPNATITLPNKTSMPDATFQVNETVTMGNATTVISKNSEQTFNMKTRNSSNIMTEDSDDEDFVPMVNKNKKNELFNPCVQSPVKKKVEAFEKAALESPAPRQGRPKTRQTKKTKENAEPQQVSTLKSSSKIGGGGGTPSLMPKPVVGRFLTPTQSSNITPIIGQVKKAPNSTSKIMAFPKSTVSSSSAKSLSRENSVEDMNRAYSKFQQTAEEKKKKREQKQQQAALVREAKEKERLERLEKIRKNNEEKAKPKAQEIKSKKDLDEIQRNLKLLAEKEEQKKRLERQKLEMAEAARKEREHLKELRKKEELEMKRREQQKLMKAKPQHRVLPKYNFDMLNSDDSTDEETKVSHKRPYPPPSWSLERNRGAAIDQQAFLSTKFIDSLFSVQPMSVNLEEIFPRIDKKFLKRNSSVIWKTPPRYSEMPKY